MLLHLQLDLDFVQQSQGTTERSHFHDSPSKLVEKNVDALKRTYWS